MNDPENKEKGSPQSNLFGDDFIERVRENLQSNKGPYKLDVFLTNRCNLRCMFCEFPNFSGEASKQEVPTEKMLDLIESTAKLRCINFSILGGEPFIRKDAIVIFRKAQEKGMRTSLVTNGTLMTGEKAEALVDMEWNNLLFSLDGATAETHDHLRGIKGSFQKTTDAIRNIQEIKRQKKSSRPNLEINFVLCKKNYQEISELMRFCSGLGIEKVNILPMIPFTENSHEYQIKEEDGDEVLHFLKEAEKVAEENEVTSNIDSIAKDFAYTKSDQAKTVILNEKKEPESKGKVACYSPWIGLCVSSEGNVTPCAAAANSDALHLGNVKIDSLEKIWNGKELKAIRKRMKNWDLPEDCQTCCTLMIEESRELRRLLENE